MADVRRARVTRPARFLTAVAGLVVAGLLAGGCATIPTAGAAQSTSVPPAGGGGGGQCCGLEVSGPQSGMSAAATIQGFLLASAVFAQGDKVAEQYLTSNLRKSWLPGPVTILANTPTVRPLPSRLIGSEQRTATVVVTGQEIATLDSGGQYTSVGLNGVAPSQTVFGLTMVGGKYLITNLPRHGLLLTKSLFQVVYQPRNLYYYGLRGHALLPDPVYVPQDSPNPVTTLVRDLCHDPDQWLRGAAVTAFPAGCRLLKIQLLPGLSDGKTAIVDIGIPRGTSRATEQAMAAQLVLTLTDPVYSPAPAQAVELKINGNLWSPGPGVSPVLTLARYQPMLPHPGKDTSLYFLNQAGAVQVLGREAARSVPVPGPAGTGQLALSRIAVSPDGRYLAGVGGSSNRVYTGDLPAARHAPAGGLRLRLAGSSVTAISWDGSDDLWVAATVHGSPGIWMLPRGSGPAVEVTLPSVPGPITGLRVAPDGVRVALIVGTGATSRLLLGAVVPVVGGYSIMHTVPLGGQGLSGVSAVTWFGENHVLAITRGPTGVQLLDVPVNGNKPVPVSAPADIVSITADGPANPLYVALSPGRRLEKSVGLGGSWTDSGAGQDPAYAG